MRGVTWYQIVVDGRAVYIRGDNVREFTDFEEQSYSSPYPAGEIGWIVSKAGNEAIYDTPGDHQISALGDRGKAYPLYAVEVDENNNSWCRIYIESENRYGYVRSDDINLYLNRTYPTGMLGWVKTKNDNTTFNADNSDQGFVIPSSGTMFPYYGYGIRNDILRVFSLKYGYGNINTEDLVFCDETKTPLAIDFQSGDYWIKDGFYASSFDGGSGTKEDPYRIATAAQLARLSKLTYDGVEGSTAARTNYYIQTGDIDLSAHEWVPIGEETSNEFFGSFDGNGYKISGMRIYTPFTRIGLFGIVGFPDHRERLINNVVLSGVVELDQKTWTPEISSIYGIATEAGSGIDNCHTDLTINVTLKPACGLVEMFIGGVADSNYGDPYRITNCSSKGSVNVTLVEGNRLGGRIPRLSVGGISGWGSTIYNSFSVMNIDIQEGLEGDAGGISAYAGNCVNCYYGGKITSGSTMTHVGNIMGGHGNNEDDIHVINCYWNGTYQVPSDENKDGIGQPLDRSSNSSAFSGNSNHWFVGQDALENRLNQWVKDNPGKYRLWRASRISQDYDALQVTGNSWDDWNWYPVFDTGDVTWEEVMVGLSQRNPWTSLDGSVKASRTGSTIIVEGGIIKGGIYIRSQQDSVGDYFKYDCPSGTYILRNLESECIWIWAADGYSYNVQVEDTVNFSDASGNMIWLAGKSSLDLAFDADYICTSLYEPAFSIEIESEASLSIHGSGKAQSANMIYDYYDVDGQLTYDSSPFNILMESQDKQDLDQCIQNMEKLYQNFYISPNLVRSSRNGLKCNVSGIEQANGRESFGYEKEYTAPAATSIAVLSAQDATSPRLLIPESSGINFRSLLWSHNDHAASYQLNAWTSSELLHSLPDNTILYFPYPEGMTVQSSEEKIFSINHYTAHGILRYSTENGSIQRTPYGLAIHVDELSPFIVQWTDPEEKEIAETPTVTPTTTPSGASVIPKTGDASPLLLWTIMAVIGVTVLVLVVRKDD